MMKTILDVEQLFVMVARACKSDPVALAVSGGSDSMAMLHLFAQWRQRFPLKMDQKDLVLSVDHDLRPEAANEVAFVNEDFGAIVRFRRSRREPCRLQLRKV